MRRAVRNGRRLLRTAKQILAQISQASTPRMRNSPVPLSRTESLMTPRVGRGNSRNGTLRARHGGPACGKTVSLRKPVHKAGVSLRASLSPGTGMAQTLGNLEASYQAALIAKNQAALNILKTEKIERLKRARDFIAKNG